MTLLFLQTLIVFKIDIEEHALACVLSMLDFANNNPSSDT